MIQSLLFILVSVWVLLSLLLYLFQPKFIYYPTKDMAATPDTIGLSYEEVTLTTSDNVNISGWYLPHPQAHSTMLFLHGNGGNISHRLEKLMIFYELGLTVMIIDYRGYGMSSGKPSEQGTYLDAEAAWKYLTKDKSIPPNDIIVYGESLGAAVAIRTASQKQVGALIIESGFTSIVDMAKHYYPYLPVSLLTRIKYPSLDRIADINAPLLVIHSKEDQIVPYTHGQSLYQLAKEPKVFHEIIGDHNSGYALSGNVYRDGLAQFISNY